MVEQVRLWHDSWEDAVGTAVQAAGGTKKVAELLWPTLKPETAYTRLKHCLDPDKADKLSLGEFFMIARLARAAGEHSIARYFGHDAGYEFKPIADAENEKRVRKAKIQFHLTEAARLSQEDE
jgi:hypothetical protein